MELDEAEFWKNETIAFLALASLKGVGYWSIHKIASSNIGFKELLKSASPEKLSTFLRIKTLDDITNWQETQEELWKIGLDEARKLAKQGIRLLFSGQAGFPISLKNIPDAPLWLFVQGDLENLHAKSVGIVGTRAITEDGLFLTKLAVASLYGKQVVTISGLATGVDQIAHIESMRYGIPTVAVLGTGILNNYPSGSELIREEIIKNGGTIVSEYLPNQSANAESFVRRNRLQAGLCNTLVPTEWKIKSGTAHTVDFAYRYGKNIANVFLPNTTNDRPELAFSEESKSARAFLLPQEIPEFLNFVLSPPTQQNMVTSNQQELGF